MFEILVPTLQDRFELRDDRAQALPVRAFGDRAHAVFQFLFALLTWHLLPRSKWYPRKSKPPFCVASTTRVFSRSSSYGLIVRRRLLPTPSHDDAVTFGYRPESACLERTCTSLMVCAHRRTVRAASSAPYFAGRLIDHGRARWKRRAPRKISNWRLLPLVSPELIHYSENDNPADQEDSEERKCIRVSAVQKIADSEEGGPDHRAAGNPSDQSQRH